MNWSAGTKVDTKGEKAVRELRRAAITLTETEGGTTKILEKKNS